MAEQVVRQTTERYKAVVLERYTRLTANSLQVHLACGFPALTGRYDASQTIARARIDHTVCVPNPPGEERPYPGLPLTHAAALAGFTRGETTDIAHSPPDA